MTKVSIPMTMLVLGAILGYLAQPKPAQAGYGSVDMSVSRMADALERIEKRLGACQTAQK